MKDLKPGYQFIFQGICYEYLDMSSGLFQCKYLTVSPGKGCFFNYRDSLNRRLNNINKLFYRININKEPNE